jgi:hypothetical protein
VRACLTNLGPVAVALARWDPSLAPSLRERAASRMSDCSATAMLCLVRSIASTFTEIESIPNRTNIAAYSG